MKQALSILGFMLVLAACQRSPGSAHTAPARSQAAHCSDSPNGNARVDVETRLHQQQLTAANAEASAWVTVGQDFVRLARIRAAPAYYAQAEACAIEALARNPQELAALRLQGLVMLNAHRFSEARSLAKHLLATHPNDVQSWGTLSDAELELGNIGEAVAAAQQMMDRKPSLPSYGRAAHLRWLQGDSTGAKLVYQQAISAGQGQTDREPTAWMIVQAAWVFWHEGDYKGAAAGFELALREVPNYAPALEGKGRAALGLADYATAIDSLTRALSAHPSIETAWWLGDAHALAGHGAQATAAYERVVSEGARLDPRTLAQFYATKAREPVEALRLARSAYAERQDGYSKDALAFALYRNGEVRQAQRLAREVVALGAPDARLLYHAGSIETAAGDVQAGKTLVARALALNPRFDPLLTGAVHDTTTAQL